MHTFDKRARKKRKKNTENYTYGWFQEAGKTAANRENWHGFE